MCAQISSVACLVSHTTHWLIVISLPYYIMFYSSNIIEAHAESSSVLIFMTWYCYWFTAAHSIASLFSQTSACRFRSSFFATLSRLLWRRSAF